MAKKSTILIAILGVLTLVITVLGASFAYFNIQTNLDETTKTDITSASPSGVVTFTTKTQYLTFSISDAEMSSYNIGTKYYATNDVKVGYATEAENHVFTLAEARVNGGDKSFKCYYDFSVKLGVDNTMNPETKGDIVLNFSGDSTITEGNNIDLTDLQNKKEVKLKGYFYPLSPVQFKEDGTVVGVKIVNMELYVKNTAKEQAPYLANKKLSVIIEPTYISATENMFKCEQIIR